MATARLGELGFSEGLRLWLGSNLVSAPGGGGLTWTFDLDGEKRLSSNNRRIPRCSPPIGCDEYARKVHPTATVQPKRYINMCRNAGVAALGPHAGRCPSCWCCSWCLPVQFSSGPNLSPLMVQNRRPPLRVPPVGFIPAQRKAAGHNPAPIKWLWCRRRKAAVRGLQDHRVLAFVGERATRGDTPPGPRCQLRQVREFNRRRNHFPSFVLNIQLS